MAVFFGIARIAESVSFFIGISGKWLGKPQNPMVGVPSRKQYQAGRTRININHV